MRLPNKYQSIFILFADNIPHWGRRGSGKVKSHWVLCELTLRLHLQGPCRRCIKKASGCWLPL